MAIPFSRSLHALEVDHQRRPLLVIGGGLGLLLVWVFWLVLARVQVLESSSEAHVEAVASAHTVEALSAGRVVSVAMTLGAVVKAGDALIELDTVRERSRGAEEAARGEGADARRRALVEERAAVVAVAAAELRADLAGIDRATAEVELAASSMRETESTVERAAALHAQGLASEADLERVEEAARQHGAMLSAATAELEQARRRRELDESARRAKLAELDREMAALDAESQGSAAVRLGLDQDLVERTIRAPVDGRLAVVADLRPGSVVAAGDQVATVLPSGGHVVVAHFPVSSALGRVSAGQVASVRLDVYPWLQHGQVKAKVARVGMGVSGDLLRVELELVEIPAEMRLEHGMTGSVTVEVEETSPADLLLTAVGKKVGAGG